MTRVLSKRDVQTASVPLQPTPDPWADFRQIEVITLEMTQSYTHSLGKYSRFFIELEHGRFFATRCHACGKTYAPPRPLCPDCLKVTEWVELPGAGTVETYSVMHFASGINDDVRAQGLPMAFAYVLLDGASTLFPHWLHCDPARVHAGMRVKVAYTQQPVHHPIHLMYFVEA